MGALQGPGELQQPLPPLHEGDLLPWGCCWGCRVALPSPALAGAASAPLLGQSLCCLPQRKVIPPMLCHQNFLQY